MICKVSGMFLERKLREKEVDGKKEFQPVVVLYTDGEAVEFPGFDIDPDKIKVGQTVELDCSIKAKEWQGRTYLSIRPLASV